MFNSKVINALVDFVSNYNGIADKAQLALLVKNAFDLTKDRSVFYCEWFAIRFCKASSENFCNTVLSLSTLQKYDDRPFIVCIVTQSKNFLLLANATFLKKISHSSQLLRIDNIKGSFNGSDILRNFEQVDNCPKNFEFLFTSHENYTFRENLSRLVASTNNIIPTGSKFLPSEQQVQIILESVDRTVRFFKSKECDILANRLENKVHSVEAEIAIAAFIDNVNLRGRIIEYLITSETELKRTLIECLRNKSPLPEIFTADKLGDYRCEFDNFITETDIKTKVLFLSSNPKGYNIDKLLAFLANEKSVYLVFIVTIDEKQRISTKLCSIYNRQLLNGTRIIKHWSGRNSRGVAQYDGKTLEDIVRHFDGQIDISEAYNFLHNCLAL